MTIGRYIFRIVAPAAILVAVIAVICASLVYFAARHAELAHTQVELRQLGEIVHLRLGDAPNRATIEMVLQQAAQYSGAQVALIMEDGFMVEGERAGVLSGLEERPDVRQARADGSSMWMEVDPIDEQEYVHFSQRLRVNEPDGPIVRVSRRRADVSTLNQPLSLALIFAVAGSGLLISLYALMLNRQWFRPVRKLTRMARALAEGDWQVRTNLEGDAVIRNLGNRLNAAAAAAEQQMSELRRQRRDLQALMDCLPDPVVLIDADQIISVMNAPAAALLRVQRHEALGRKLMGIVPDRAIVEMLERERDRRFGSEGAGDFTTREIRLSRGGQRFTYHATATGMADGGVLLVLRDISAVVGATTMKTDFVANASHELRTPIAAIKIAFETMREVYGEDPEAAERCVMVISGHLKRLEEMVRDLLHLSRMENPELRPRMAPVRSGDVLNGIRAALANQAREKDVELVLEEPDGEMSFVGDERMLHLICKNLAENSIKFTPAGGRVSVSLSLVGGSDERVQRVCATVADTGCGIPLEHKERVFERFYQVDAARAPAAGRGTGLGLAIVKHAVAALGGEISLESEVGVGTTVTCLFKYVAAPSDDPVRSA